MPLKQVISNDFIPIDREFRGAFKPTKDSAPKKKHKGPGQLEETVTQNFNLVVGGREMLGSAAKKDPIDGSHVEITKSKQVGGRPPKVEHTLPLSDELTGSK